MRRPRQRDRLGYLLAAVATIGLGLAVHLYGRWLGPTAHDVAGDALWAVMIVWWMGVLAPRSPLVLRAGAALVICFAVELLQLYQSPSLDAIRSTTLGHLVLGSDFDARDCASYTGGVLAAMFLERWLEARGILAVEVRRG